VSRNVCVVGLGYIGLPTASLLATKGHRVRGVDVSPAIVETINQGKVHLVEPDLDVMVRSAVGSGNLTASLEPSEADVFIVAVPTPFGEGHSPDLSYVDAATEAIAPHVRSGNLVILESTSPVGTTERVAARLRALRPDLAGDSAPFVAHCPERVLPGRILLELIENDRIIGGVNDASTAAAVAFYRSFVRGDVLGTDARTAEMCKLVENSFRDVNIAFANELSMISDQFDIDVWELIKLANRHPRVNILQPGPGVGGHCIAVDPWFIVSAAPETSTLIRSAREVNLRKTDWAVEQILAAIPDHQTPTVACMGLSYKPDIDDLRESPALAIYGRLSSRHTGNLLAVEPHLTSTDARPIVSIDDAIEAADVLVFLVSHSAFKDLDPDRFKGKVVLDLCGVFQ